MWLVELLILIVFGLISIRGFEDIFTHNTPELNREYAKHIDYLIIAKNADGTPLLSGVMMYLMAIIALPFGYAALWLHRLVKWLEIRRLKKQFEQESALLPQQSNHMVLD
jgi:hypothetical protein